MRTALILEDDENRIERFKKEFSGHFYITFARSAEEAEEILSEEKSFDVIFLDHDLGGRRYVDPSDPNTGFQVAKMIVKYGTEYKTVIVHSMNYYGAVRIKYILHDAELVPYVNLFRVLELT